MQISAFECPQTPFVSKCQHLYDPQVLGYLRIFSLVRAQNLQAKSRHGKSRGRTDIVRGIFLRYAEIFILWKIIIS